MKSVLESRDVSNLFLRTTKPAAISPYGTERRFYFLDLARCLISMTLCVGWKFKDEIYLFGDTVFSQGKSNGLPASEKTSFGELQGNGKVHGRSAYVEENGIKIRAFAGGAIAYSGSEAKAVAMADVVEASLSEGISPKDALRRAFLNVQPVEVSDQTSLLLACSENGSPVLYHFDTEDAENIKSIDGLIQIGSIGAHHKTNMENIIKGLEAEISKRFRSDVHSRKNILARISGYLQSIGVHDPILTEGVGGAFVGLCYSLDGVEWQPDILHVIHSPDPSLGEIIFCGVFVRNQVLGLVSTVSGLNKFIAWKFSNEDFSDAYSRAVSVSDEIVQKYDSGKFDAIVFLNNGPHTVTVLEMNNNTHHQLAVVDAFNPESGKLGIVWMPGLLRVVNTISKDDDGNQPDLSVMWLPYVGLEASEIAEIDNFLQDQYDLQFSWP